MKIEMWVWLSFILTAVGNTEETIVMEKERENGSTWARFVISAVAAI